MGASAADRHRALLGQDGQDVRKDVPLADLLGPLAPLESVPAAKWRRGAEGERRTALLLAPLRHLGWTLLHDRRIPGSAANIDHLVIGPSGVWVVDSKSWQGRVKVLGDGRLWYGRRCLDDDLRALRWAADVMYRTLSEHGPEAEPLQVHPVLCVHGAHLPREQLFFEQVTLSAPEVLLDLLTSATPRLTAAEVGRLSARAATFIPAKTNQATRKESH